MISYAKFLAGATAAALLAGTAYAGPLKFSGNSSVNTSDLMAVTVNLKEGEGGLVPDPGGRLYQLRNIDALKLSPSAISAILRGVSELYQEKGILATRAVVTAQGYKASLNGEPLAIKIVEGKITKTRIVGTEKNQHVSDAKRARIQAAAPIGAGETISAKNLDGTVGLMNRFSRQQVRPVLVPEDGELILEYRVKQLDESVTTVDIDNYGSERVGRERGSIDFTRWNALTPDDKFHFKALTSFDGNSSFVGADYMMPLDEIASSRLGFNLSYSNFTAEDVGLAGAGGIDFEGNSFNLGLNWEKTLWNDNGKYLDAIIGLRYLDVTQDQTSIGIPEASTGFLLPSAGLRYSRTTSSSSLIMGGRLEMNLSSIADTDSGLELARQGRLFAEDSFVTGSVYAAYRLYLDELLTGKEGRHHELSAFFSANTSFGDRLPPSFLNVAGGFSTVRGYPLGAASGDSSLMLKLDYKYHFDTIDLGGSPLDLTAVVFSDIASVKNEDALIFERDDTLWSLGLGLDAVFSENLRASLGYGVALDAIDSPTQAVESGDGEFYFQLGYTF
ncbi:ShlB/FhaC/HecB family hemolysin secretion/activation protein [Verrucomicrobiaceae bacterium 227]